MIIGFCYLHCLRRTWCICVSYWMMIIHVFFFLFQSLGFFFIISGSSNTTERWKSRKTCWSKHHYQIFFFSFLILNIIDILRAHNRPADAGGNFGVFFSRFDLVAHFHYALLVSSVFFFSNMKSIAWKLYTLGVKKIDRNAEFMQNFNMKQTVYWQVRSFSNHVQYIKSFRINIIITIYFLFNRFLTNFNFFLYPTFTKGDNYRRMVNKSEWIFSFARKKKRI